MLISYRCKVCGAPIDPETGYCEYCDTMNFKPIIRRPIKDEKPRIIVRDGDKEAEIKPTKLALTMESSQMIEITMCDDTERKFIPGIVNNQYARFSVESYMTADVARILKSPTFDVVFTGFVNGYGHKFLAYAENVSLSMFGGKDIINHFDIVSVHPVDLWNIRRIHNPIIEGMRCPICGAALDTEKSKCDYCGYWWVYSPEDGKCK